MLNKKISKVLLITDWYIRIFGIKASFEKLASYAAAEGNPMYPVPVLMDEKELQRFYYELMWWKGIFMENILKKQQAFFKSGKTLPIENRLLYLKKLKKTDIHLHLVDVISPEEYKGMSTVEISDCVYERMIADLGESFRA